MQVPGVISSQQMSVPTPHVKEQDRGAIPQRRAPDTLEGKNRPSSCSFRYCLTRIRDFFCALFRCLFCIKNKPKKPNIEENEEDKKPAQNQPVSNPADVSESEGEKPNPRAQPILEEPAVSVPATSKHVPADPTSVGQHYSLWDANDLAEWFRAKKKVSAKTEPQAPIDFETPEAAARAFLETKAPGYLDDARQQEVVASLKTAAMDFAKLSPKVQDQVLRKMKQFLPDALVYDALQVYLSQECLGAERYNAFLGLKIAVSSENSSSLAQIFADGFGSTCVPPKKPKTPIGASLDPKREASLFWDHYVDNRPETQEFMLQKDDTKSAFAKLSLAAQTKVLTKIQTSVETMHAQYSKIHTDHLTEKLSQPGFLIFDEAAKTFMFEYKLYAFSSLKLLVRALKEDAPRIAFGNLGRTAREEILAFIERNAGHRSHEFYKHLHDCEIRLQR